MLSLSAIFGNWFDHTLSYWSHRDDENVFFITFEEMKKVTSALLIPFRPKTASMCI